MSIATKTGDEGVTSLMFGRRVSKCDVRVEAYGTVDELNAALGIVRGLGRAEAWIQEVITPIQRDLVILMGELATHPDDLARYAAAGYTRVTRDFVLRLDNQVQRWEAEMPRFKDWVMPGGNAAGAALDLARTICRRAERQICLLQEQSALGNAEILVFLNRLADLLWLMARLAEQGRSDPTGVAGPGERA